MEERKLKITNDNSFSVLGFMRTELNLKGNELMVYAIIYHFSQFERQYFTCSLQYLRDFIGGAKQTVINTLNSLLKKGLIEKVKECVNGIWVVKYRATKIVGGWSKNWTTSLKIRPQEKNEKKDKKKEKENDIKEKEIIKEKKDKKECIYAQSFPKQISLFDNDNFENETIISFDEEVLNYWNKRLKKRERLTNNKRKAISKQLEIKSIDIIKLCIDRYATILEDVDYYFKYEWNLEDFFKRQKGIDCFMDDGDKWQNYLRSKTNGKKFGKKIVEEPEWLKNNKDYQSQELSEKEQEEANALVEKLFGGKK